MRKVVRSKKIIKKPEEKKKHTEPIVPFEIIFGPTTITGHMWKGVSAYLLDPENGDSVVLTCPNLEILKRYWAQFSTKPLNVPMTKDTVGNYHFIEKVEETKKKIPKTTGIEGLLNQKAEYINESPIVWIYNRKEKRCHMTYQEAKYDKFTEELGEATRKTIGECRILLRDFGIEREDIMLMKIDLIDPSDDIPF